MGLTNLQTFIKTQFLNKMNLPPFHFTSQSQHFLNQIYNHLLRAESDLVKTSIIITPLYLDEMFTGESYDYIPIEIRNQIHKSEKIGYQCQFNLSGREIYIKIVFPIESTSNTITSIQKKYKTETIKMVKQIFLWLFIAEKYACRKCSKKMTLFFYMTDHLKLLPVKGNSLGLINANTAFTTPCSHSTDIHLFRKEEWFKVFIHETFHNLGLDFSTMPQDKAELKILKLFPMNISDIRIFESYCENWAELMNILFTAYLNTQNKRDFGKIVEKMEKYLQLERVFSLFQCTKVLNHSQLKYTDIYQNAEHKPILGKIKQYKEKTNAFSYFVLKPIIMFYMNDFISWSIAYNGATLDFKKTQANMIQYVGLFEQLYDLPEYLHYMDIMSQLYKPTNNLIVGGNGSIKPDEVNTQTYNPYQSLRMSITGD